jgi:hypothetical protein
LSHYTVEVANGANETPHQVQLNTPSINPSRQIAVN